MFIPFPVILLASQLVVTVADDVPQFDSAALCRQDEAAAGVPLLGKPNACVTDEQEARDKVAKVWSQLSPADREQCTQTAKIGGPGSYVELLVCVEMRAVARTLPESK